jgi:hypothetical protein
MYKDKYISVEKSFEELYRIYKPKNLDKFISEFIIKYRIPNGYEEQLKCLVSPTR